MIRPSKSKPESDSRASFLKTRLRLIKTELLVDHEKTLPAKTRRLEQKIRREGLFTHPIITSEIPADYRTLGDQKWAIINDGHHRKAVCQQLGLDIPEFRVHPNELMLKGWSHWFYDVPPNDFEAIKREFYLQSMADWGRNNGRTAIQYGGGCYVFNFNAPIAQPFIETVCRREDLRGVSISDEAITRFVESQLTNLFGGLLPAHRCVLVEDDALTDSHFPERDLFVVAPRWAYKEVMEITYLARLPLVAKATRMILATTGRPIDVPIPLSFLKARDLTPQDKTAILQGALAEVQFEALSNVAKEKLAKRDRRYPETIYVPRWTAVTMATWLAQHFKEWGFRSEWHGLKDFVVSGN